MTSPQPPDPARVQTMADLVDALEALRRRAPSRDGGELTVEALSNRLRGKVSRSTLWNIFGGKLQGPPRLGAYRAILTELGVPLVAMQAWDDAYWRVKDRRKSAGPAPPWWIIAGAVLALALGSFVVVREGYARFYAALSVRLGDLPIGTTDMVFPMLLVSVLAVLVWGMLFVAAALGTACAPWRAPTRATIPAGGLAFLVWSGGVLGYALTPDSLVSFLVFIALSMSLLGFVNQVGLIKGYRSWRHKQVREIAGAGVGLGVAVGVLLTGEAGRRLGLPGRWPLALVLASMLGAAAGLGWWLWRELRRAGQPPVQAPAIAELGSGFWDAVRALLGRRQPWADKVKALVVLLAVAGLLLWATVTWIDGRAAAGRAVVELGYLPPDHESFVVDTPVEPATIAQRRAGADPFEVCQRSTPWAASLLDQGVAHSLVLLRPLEGNPHGVRTVRLPAADYIVRIEQPASALRDGDGAHLPWEQVACESPERPAA